MFCEMKLCCLNIVFLAIYSQFTGPYIHVLGYGIVLQVISENGCTQAGHARLVVMVSQQRKNNKISNAQSSKACANSRQNILVGNTALILMLYCSFMVHAIKLNDASTLELCNVSHHGIHKQNLAEEICDKEYLLPVSNTTASTFSKI